MPPLTLFPPLFKLGKSHYMICQARPQVQLIHRFQSEKPWAGDGRLAFSPLLATPCGLPLDKSFTCSGLLFSLGAERV